MRTVPNTQSRTFLSIGHTDSIALKLLVPCSEIRLEFSWLNGAGAITPDDVVQLTGDVMKLISDKLISVEVDDGTLITPLTPLLCPTLMLPHDHPADLLAGRPRFALFALQVRYAKITKLVVNISQQMIPVKFQGFLLGRVYYVAE